MLIITVLLPVQAVNRAFAQPGITIGFAVDGSGLVISTALADEVGSYLEEQLSVPVRVRKFTKENFLYDWLVRYREVDFAWLSKALLDQEADGTLYPLVENQDHSQGLYNGSIVARQGQQTALLRQVSAVFLSMHENPEGRSLLTRLEISRFVSSSLWQTSEWIGVTPPQSGPIAFSGDDGLKQGRAQSEAPEAEVPAVPLASETVPHREELPTEAEPQPARPLALSKVPTVTERPDEPLQLNLEAQQTSGMAQSGTVESPQTLSDSESFVAEASSLPVPTVERDAPVALAADSLIYDSAEDSYEAMGDVVLRQGAVELKSETLLWQAATQDAAAEGSVELEDAGSKLSGESMQYNMATRQGQIRDARLFVREGNFHLAGEQIEKDGAADYLVKDGSFTTCDGEIPDWKFSAEEVDVKVGGYAQAKNVWFHIRDVPVLYTPYMSFPVKTERESGLLTPYFGYSSRKGVRASAAWYQVIDTHMDATVYLDYLSEIGLGKGLEYRYALPGQNTGKALYYHVTGTGEIEEQDTQEDFPDLDYYRWEHRGLLPGDWRLLADIEYTDEKLFFEEFGEFAADYNRDKTVSTLTLRRNWQKLNLTGFARYIKDLEVNDADTLQTLPELGLGLSRHRLGDTAFYVGLESYVTSFWRDEGDDGERLYLRPSLSAAFKPGSWLEVTPEIAFYERLYKTDVTDTDKFIPEFSVALSTRLAKSFDANLLGADRIRHSIEPTLTYTYLPDEEQGDLPLFDLRDRIERRNDVTFALINRLTARSQAADGSSSYRELVYLRLSQRYNIDEARNDRSGENRPFSDLRAELDFTPVRNFSLSAESIIPVYGDAGFRTLSVGSTLKDDTGNAAKISYRYTDVDFEQVATDYMEFQLDTSILQPLYIRFRERYDFQENRALEDFVGFEYRSKCWSLILSYKTRYLENADNDHEIGFTFVLAGLGSPKGFAEGVDKGIQ